jgi:hypothetical protein
MLLVCRANKKPKIGGSVFGRQDLWREWIQGHNKLMRMYFNKNPTYSESNFLRCFRISINLFKNIAMEVIKFDRFLEQ